MKDPLEEASSDVTRKGAGISLLLVLLGLILLAILRPSTIDTLAIIFGIVALIMLHEAGHYFTAKRAGMKVTEFFLGFGPRVWSFRRGQTEYGVKAIPAGGYVRIVGMSNLEDIDPEEEPRTFRHGTFGNRLTVILAGVSVNLILAFVLIYAALLGRGLPDTLEAKVERVLPDSPAAAAGVRDGDRIVGIDGQRLDVDRDIGEALQDRVGQPTTIVVQRDGGSTTLTAVPKARSSSDNSGIIGVSVSQSVATYESFNPIEGVPASFSTMGQMTRDTAAGIGRLFSPSGIENYSKNFTGDAPKQGSPASNDRPRSIIGIVDIGGELVGGNVWSLLFLLGAINLIVALFNLIPLLPFDGGHAAVVIYEQVASKIRGRVVRVDFRKLVPVTALVLVVFLTLGLSAMFLDLRQIFTGS
ncbi:MAG TPA: M50 family metallopeptidase [Acidimicrobiia bacterium]|nr:M50 family metallopeptidase [Acidimicrobiia bacterium]